jgi:hypothetical protein
MFINDIFNDNNKKLDEVSNELIKKIKPKKANEDAIDDRFAAQYNTPQALAKSQTLDQLAASGTQADYDRLGVMSPQQIERDYQAMRAKEPAQDAAVYRNPALTPSARTSTFKTNPKGVPIKEQGVAEGISVVDQDYDLDQLILTLDIEGKRVYFTYTDYEEDFANAERRDVFDQLQEQPWYKGLDHPTKMEILDAAFRAIRGLEPQEYRPTVGDEPLDEQGVAEAGPFSYGAKKPKKGSVADLAAKKRQEQERGKQPAEPKDHMVGVAKVIKDVGEGSVQHKLHRRHQELRKKRGAPDPEYYRELKATFDLPDEERFAKAAELKKKYKVSEARKSEVNFDIEDIKKLERIRDLPTLKAQAMALISKPSERPMKPEKVAWFDAALDRMDSPLKIIKLMYDLLLSGEGHQVIGSKRSMNPNSYRNRFGESTITNEDVEKYVEELERAGYEILEEKTRLDPSCWKGYRKAGTKMKGDVRVNNCVPVKKKVDEYGAANGPPNLNKSDIKRMMPPEPVAEQIPTITDTGPREQPHPAAQALGLVRGLKKLAGIDKYDVENAVNQEITNVVRSPQDASSKNVSIINRLFGPRQ